MTRTGPDTKRAGTDVARFSEELSNWGRWGEQDQLGALNLITQEKRVAAAKLVQRGRCVSCARPLPTEPAADNPRPATHHMTGTASEGAGADYIAVASHGYATSHIDALCHIFHEGRLYNGYPAQRVTAHGALELGIHELRDGIVSRGVLLDVPRLRDTHWLEPGEAILPEDLEACESRASLRVEAGDVLLVRTGRWAYREKHGAWDPHDKLAGLHAECLPWLRERGVAALGSDGVSDVVPSQVEGFRLPIHSIAIPILGIHLLDNLDLEALGDACSEEGRWEFLLHVAPLVIRRGTASPVNPIATF
jgi:kynurenine formamidase